MNKVHKRTRLIGGVLAASMFTLVAVAPSASAAPPQKAAVSTGSASFAITREDSMSIDYTEAITPPGRIPLTGDFVGDNTDTGNLDDIFWYTPGAGGDSIWRTNGDRSWTATSTSVTGSFTPIVGQFTNDGKADIFWYAPGPAVDSLWDFNANGSITKIDGAAVNGTYTPIVGYFSEDSSQDIIWYSPGRGRDIWWDFDGATGERTSRDLSINGTYTPVVGSFAGIGSPTFDYAQDILWYAPGSTADSLWDFNGNGGTVTKSPLSINGTYTPVAGDFSHDGFNDVIWYAPGTASDSMWDFDNATGAHSTIPLTINGSYTPIARGELFEQSAHQTDILWFGAGNRADAIWDFDYGTGHTSPPVTLFGNRTPVLGVFELTETDCCTLQGLDIIDRTL